MSDMSDDMSKGDQGIPGERGAQGIQGEQGPPGVPSAKQLGTLIDGIGTLTGQVVDLKNQAAADARQKVVDEAAAEHREHQKTRRIVAGFVIVVLVASAGIAIGIVGSRNAHSASQAAQSAQADAARLLQQRTESRIVACQSTLDFEHKHNNLTLSVAQVLQNSKQAADANTSIDAEKRASIDAFYDQQVADVTANVIVDTGPGTVDGYRDCSPSGVDAYYNH